VGSAHSGEVKNLTPYGVFVELEEGIGGMVHISDLSWTKRYSHPSEFTKVGENIDISILDIDKDNRKLSLGHKQLEENPWDTFENVFPQGSYHEATLIRRDDRGGIVQLPYGWKHLLRSNI
jgi:small subunit ribosomal protein S1